LFLPKKLCLKKICIQKNQVLFFKNKFVKRLFFQKHLHRTFFEKIQKTQKQFCLSKKAFSQNNFKTIFFSKNLASDPVGKIIFQKNF
jgi:hypothetical protein